MPQDASSSFARFVPRLVLQELVHRGLPECPGAAVRQGAVLFADLSGFSRLAERLAADPDAGAEQLSRILNARLGELLRLVDSHRGDVLKFAGDAFLAFWSEEEGELAGPVLRASRCALGMQALFTETGGDDRVDLRVGVAAGEVVVMHLNSLAGHREIMITGRPLVQLTSIQTLIAPGEVVLTHPAWAQVEGLGDGVPLQNGAVRLRNVAAGTQPTVPERSDPPLPRAELLRPYVPVHILPWLVEGYADWIAELRLVSVLFVELPGLNYIVSPVAAEEMLSFVLPPLERFGGSVDNISSDDKGITILATFGLPPFAHEDDSLRAVRAALAIEEELRRREVFGSVGVATGPAFCGLLGNGKRAQYTVLGDVVNRASRLMIASSDGVLCDAATRVAVGERVTFLPYPAMKLKGVSDVVAVFKPVGASELRPAVGPIIGRSAEREALRAHRARLLEGGRGAAVLIRGDAGIGKSRLVDEFSAETAALGVTVLRATAEAIDAATPYHSWRTIFARILDVPALGRSVARQRYEKLERLANDPSVGPLLPLLNPLLGLDLPETPLTQQMDAELRARNLQALLLSILEKAVVEPAILLFEDVHWLDSASWGLLRQVRRRIGGVLILMTCRPGVTAARIERETDPAVELVAVRPLAREETEQLLRQRLSGASLPEGVVDLIVARAEGNPFFTEELARAVKDVEMRAATHGGSTLAHRAAHLASVALPTSLQGLIVSRVDRLPPGPQLCLKVASVIGRNFSVQALGAIYPLRDELQALDAYLTELRDRGLVQLDLGSPDAGLRFQHAVIQEATYSLLPIAQRQRLHRALTEWYEHRYASDLAPVYPVLVHHSRAAGADEMLRRYLDLAGRQALTSGAYREAVAYLIEAREVDSSRTARSDRDTDRALWGERERQIAEAYYGLGKLEESRAALKRVLALIDRPVPSGTLGLSTMIARDLTHQLASRLRIPRLRRVRSSEDELVEACLAYERLAELAFFLGENTQIIYAVLRNLNLAERAAAPAQAARSSAHMTALLDLVPLHSLARYYEAMALESAANAQHAATSAHVHQVIGLSNLGLGRLERAEEYLTRGADIFERLGHRRKWIECRSLCLTSLYHQGEFIRYAEEVERLLPQAAQSGGAQAQRWFLYDRSRLEALRGNHEAALEHIDAAISLRSGSVDPSDEFRFYGLKAITHLRLGNRESASNATRIGLELANSIRSLAFYTFDGFAELAEVALQLAPPGEGGGLPSSEPRPQPARALRGLFRYSRLFPLAQPAAERIMGLAEWRRGRRSRAVRCWRRSLAVAERLGMPYARALTHLMMGHLLTDSRTGDSVDHLAEAERILTELGCRHDRNGPAPEVSEVRISAVG